MADLSNIINSITAPLPQQRAEAPRSRTSATLQQLLAAARPREAELIRRCAIPRWFDLQILRMLRERDDGNEEALDLLRGYSFVRQTDESHYAFHDDIREALLDEWGAQRPDDLRRLNAHLAAYFDSLVAQAVRQTSDSPSATQALIEREGWAREALYHRLRADLPAGEIQLDTQLTQEESRDNPAQADALLRTEIDATRPDYDLFRRAIVEGDGDAWAQIAQRFRPLMVAWAHQSPAQSITPELAVDLADQALARAWAALTPQRFAQFPSLGALLAYLRACVTATVIDHLRAEASQARAEQIGTRVSDVDPEQVVVDELSRRDLWRLVQGMAQSEQERVILDESFGLGYRPHTILARHQDLFADISMIYNVKRNLLARLSRNHALRRLYEEAG